MSRDPIGYERGTLNLFEYVNGQTLISLDPYGLLKWKGSITFQVLAAGWFSSRVYTRFHAQAEDECCVYITSFKGYLDATNVLINGMGYVSFESQFNDVEASLWPVNTGKRVGVTYFGIASGVGGADIGGGFESYYVGGLNWWDYWTAGGFHVRTFAGGIDGRAPDVKKSSGRKSKPECKCVNCEE